MDGRRANQSSVKTAFEQARERERREGEMRRACERQRRVREKQMVEDLPSLEGMWEAAQRRIIRIEDESRRTND